MNAADLARLELAKRAYKATEPRDAEVLTGVRRARLALTRPKARRAWFSRGLVFVVLAVGSLAYAKPQALEELVEKVLPREDVGERKRLLSGVASAPAEAVAQTGNTLRARSTAAAAALDEDAPGAADVSEPSGAPTPARTLPRATRPSQSKAEARLSPKAPANAAPTEPASAMTDWGRVGQALASGDKTEALAALSELSESDDQRTRDKADLGRAQLLMAREPDQACALARSLSQRRAGSRIERQAQQLLKSCSR